MNYAAAILAMLMTVAVYEIATADMTTETYVYTYEHIEVMEID